jgi:predicted nucleic acid-binding protein
MILVDSNVVIDIIAADQDWRAWSDATIDRLQAEGEQLVVNLIVVAEVASNFDALPNLEATLDSIDIEVVPLNGDVAFAAGQAVRAYRRLHRDRNAMLSDFLIGAHAQTLGATLLTRDTILYRTYFPDITLITPETDA